MGAIHAKALTVRALQLAEGQGCGGRMRYDSGRLIMYRAREGGNCSD